MTCCLSLTQLSCNPKILYILRCNPNWRNEHLNEFDQIMREALQVILNKPFDDSSWIQAALLARQGGLRFRLTTSLALPEFLSSIHQRGIHYRFNFTFQFSRWIIFKSIFNVNGRYLTSKWFLKIDFECFNYLRYGSSRSTFLEKCEAWLVILPVSCLGFFWHWKFQFFFRLGSDVCVPHKCSCGSNINVKEWTSDQSFCRSD